jgi:hypothetical protein
MRGCRTDRRSFREAAKIAAFKERKKQHAETNDDLGEYRRRPKTDDPDFALDDIHSPPRSSREAGAAAVAAWTTRVTRRTYVNMLERTVNMKMTLAETENEVLMLLDGF